jgi:hypothetical protein
MSRPVVLAQRRPEDVRDNRGVRVPKSNALMFGSTLADVFRVPAYDCKAVGPDQKPEFAVTRLRSGPREMEKAPAYPPDQAALICVSLTPSAIGQWQALYKGKKVGVTRAIPFATTFIDLNCRMEMWVRGPFDYLHYYLFQGLLQRIALDNAVSTSFRLQEAFFIEDLVVAQMTKSLLTPGWKRGNSSEPRRCCARILKEISRSRNSPARAHFRKVISRGASGLVLAPRSINV